MSDASFDVPDATTTDACAECGCRLTLEEIGAGREFCFACYSDCQD